MPVAGPAAALSLRIAKSSKLSWVAHQPPWSIGSTRTATLPEKEAFATNVVVYVPEPRTRQLNEGAAWKVTVEPSRYVPLPRISSTTAPSLLNAASAHAMALLNAAELSAFAVLAPNQSGLTDAIPSTLPATS